MARLLLGTPPATHSRLDSRLTTSQQAKLSPAEIEARLRQPRSAAYLAAMTQLDSGGHVCDRPAVEELVAVLQQEFPDLAVEHGPVGIVSKCYLGAPFEVHTLDRAGCIIQHYKNYEALPGAMEQARSLSLNLAYAFIEIYTDKMIAVTKSGSTSVVPIASAGQS